MGFARLMAMITLSASGAGCGDQSGNVVHAGDPTTVRNAVDRAQQQAERARANAQAANHVDQKDIPSPFEPLE
jgi:hypothetical protein